MTNIYGKTRLSIFTGRLNMNNFKKKMERNKINFMEP